MKTYLLDMSILYLYYYIKPYLLTIHFLFRLSELIALVSLSTTVFLFLHTRSLSQRLQDVQRPFDPAGKNNRRDI